MNKLKELFNAAEYVTDKISSAELNLDKYITTDNILPNKQGKVTAESLPAQTGNVTKYQPGDTLVANIRPYLKKIWYANKSGGCSADVLVIRSNDSVNPKFLFYSLFRDDFFSHVMKGSKGTKMPRGDKDH
ncbi:MAG: restriction endonuclease subunit S, partial [Gammaproteobacteria bacterium]|nr:restriction endonuclease subunit S [Gammaproteobacteria bacterium]